MTLLSSMWRGRCQNCIRLPALWNKKVRVVRLYSVLRGPTASEDVQVTCGSSGTVTINIFNNRSSNGAGLTRPLIIYIPSLPPFEAPNGIPFSIPSALLSNNTVVRINPRWSSPHFFPTPLHDTFRAYNWIIENLAKQELHSPSSSSSTSIVRHNQRPIGIYGTDLGGTLATSLALTESHKPSPPKPYISALAVQSAIFDWSAIATTSPPVPPSHDADLSRLYSLRAQLFRSPSSAFDAFASPLLFFRTTGLATPAVFPTTLAEEEASRVESVNVLGGQYVGRESHLRFPPKGSGLRIPETRIAVLGGGSGSGSEVEAVEERDVEEVVVEEGGDLKGKGKGKVRVKGKRKTHAAEREDGVLREQAEEMLKLMRRSVALHEGKDRYDDGFDGVTEAERRVGLVELASPQGGQGDDGEWAAEFFEEVLGKDQERE